MDISDSRASVVVLQVKPPQSMLAFHIQAHIQDLAALFLTQLLATSSGKAADDGPSA